MSALALASVLAATLLVGNAVDSAPHDSGITFARSEVVPIEGARGLMLIPKLTRHSGDVTTVGIAIPHLGAAWFASFKCDSHTFALKSAGELKRGDGDGDGDRIGIENIEPIKDEHAAAFTPIADADEHWLAIETAVCGKPT